MDRGWTGIVLAGGKSSRMGQDKALLEVDGATLLQHAIERFRPLTREVIVIGDPEKYLEHWSHVIADDAPGEGPLRGISTGLKHARYLKVLITACDMPNLNDRLMVQLKKALINGGDAVVPRHADGVEPLAGAYHKSCYERFDRCLVNGIYRLTDAITKVDTRYLEVEPGKEGWPNQLFRNINTQSDL